MGTPLGDFIRARRDATRPETLGLPAGPRRRAPGVRRSELATLAGVSVEYLVRIEQGRDRNPSMPVVRALGDALRLGVAEREHLRYLAKITSGGCGGLPPQSRLDVRPAVRELLDQLEPGIALVTNRLGDILAYTSGFDLIARPAGLLDADQPNLTRFVFTDERAGDTFPDWDLIADECAFDLWLGPSAERSAAFQAELVPLAGDQLTRRLNRHALPPRGALRWSHPAVGHLRFNREIMELPPADAQQLVVFLPADETTAGAVHGLRTGSGAKLRAVN